MVDKIASEARVYTDIQGLEKLRYESKSNADGVKKEVSHQFEAILMQMVMRSMRDANSAFSSDLFGNDNDQMGFYQDMFDKQLSMSVSPTGNSFAQTIEKNINQQYFTNSIKQSLQTTKSAHHTLVSVPMQAQALPQPEITSQSMVEPIQEKHADISMHSPEEFIKKLWGSAKSAAKSLGADPRILLAQAALETNWGKKILPHDKNGSSFNLFNIKADPSWTNKTTTMSTLEQQDGVIAKVKASFRSYGSFTESFKDYVNFLKQNGRYSEALSKVANPQQFINELQKAGFATDANYGEKIWKIFSSHSFKKIVGNLE